MPERAAKISSLQNTKRQMMAGEEVGNVNTALLVQLLEQMGAVREDVGNIKNQLDHGSRKHGQLDQQLVQLTTAVTPLVADMAVIKPKVLDQEKFIGRLGTLVGAATFITTGVLWLIVASFGFIQGWVKTNILSHLHWS